ncbi:MAG TPA: FtsX-like permease family protein [Ignavibacteria bacterium]|nr:FtsX-like permease family protein [Ignavibacteria bacterium]
MILFYLKETFRSIKRSKLASFITIISLSIAILATDVSIVLVLLSNKIDEELKERVELDIFIMKDAPSSDIQALGSRLRKDNRLQIVEYISQEKAEINFIKETGEDFKSILEANPLPASYRVKFKSQSVDQNTIEQFVKEIEKDNTVDEVIYDYSTIISLINFINSSKYIIFVLSFVFVFLAIYLVYSTNKLQIQNKLEKYNTMKLVGAKLSTLKIPIYFTGLIFGVIASVISITLIVFFTEFIQRFYYNFNFINYIYIGTFIIIFLGIFYGLLGSFITSRGISLKINKI